MGNKLQGWIQVDLHKICNLFYGKGLSVKDLQNDGFPVYGANGIIGFYDKYLYEFPKIIISCRGANSGVIHKTSPKSYVTSNSIIVDLISEECIDIDYLRYSLLSIDRKIIVTGTAQPQITIENLKNLNIPIAPNGEQKRIAAKLDKLMATVQSANIRLEKILQTLKRIRQSILATAVSGNLTEDWRERNGIVDEWVEKTLRELATKLTYGSSKKSDLKGKIPVLRMGNIQAGKIDWDDLKYSSDTVEIKKYKLESGDVLFNRTNSPELVGKTAIYRNEQPAIYAGYIIKIKTNEKLNSEFLNLCLNTIQAREWCNQVKTDGVSQSNINAQKLADFVILTPSITEQQEIVRRVEALFKVADRIEERYKKAKAQTDRLQQSILAKAFRGELVPQDPNDEPASILLEKIKAEKEKLSEKEKKSKKKFTKKAS